MHFTSIFTFAVSATAVLAVSGRSNTLEVRAGACGSYYDNFLGPGTAGNINGNGQCHNFKKSGESPNAQSKHTLKIKGQCVHCDFYVDENCSGRANYGAGNTRGDDWEVENTWGHVKSFKC
ncbi:hypothetical protein DM02DRAFT_623919 [Periconia macrospinosa]|uniref:Uncharacterized protein n=1 Tax=Periconia macrospinosa TaxID=97972 RepID=A0A2V1E600_9PLEO|nr:hypothetical protein DM02DRAFT_623919 [Periconia macrospinosa]